MQLPELKSFFIIFSIFFSNSNKSIIRNFINISI